jgi:hypothetical protein
MADDIGIEQVVRSPPHPFRLNSRKRPTVISHDKEHRSRKAPHHVEHINNSYDMRSQTTGSTRIIFDRGRIVYDRGRTHGIDTKNT